MTAPGVAPGYPVQPSCYLHSDRRASATCRRCGRPICTDCMREAPVGWQCPQCVREGARISPVVRWRPRAGGRLGNTRPTAVTLVLIIANVAVFIWEKTNLASIQNRFSMWPDGVHYFNQWYRVLTSAFLHANTAHILFNMMTLAIVGPPVEAEIGRVRFGALYLLAAVGGSVGYYLLADPRVGGLGASGAIFGLMGAYYVLARLRRWDMEAISALLVLNIVVTFAFPDIAWQAHLGGLIAGVLITVGMVAEPGMLRTLRAGGATRGRRMDLTQVLQAVTVVVVACVAFGLLLQLSPQAI